MGCGGSAGICCEPVLIAQSPGQVLEMRCPELSSDSFGLGSLAERSGAKELTEAGPEVIQGRAGVRNRNSSRGASGKGQVEWGRCAWKNRGLGWVNGV